MGLRHLPLAFAGLGWFRHKPRARTVLSPSGVCHSLLLLSAMPVTGFGSAVPPATGFVRLRHSRLSGNEKPVAEVPNLAGCVPDLESVEFDFFHSSNRRVILNSVYIHNNHGV